MESRLEAINLCLAGIGLAPVAAEDEIDLDASYAGVTVDHVSSSIQSLGWWFNKEGNWNLTPDSITGYINAPQSALSIVPSGESLYSNLSVRGTKIYDMWYHTFDLRQRLTDLGLDQLNFTFIMRLEFEVMPVIARLAVAYAARRQFAQDMEVDERRWKFQSDDADKAYNNLLRADAGSKKRNSFRNNYEIVNFLNTVAGPNRIDTSSLNYPKRLN